MKHAVPHAIQLDRKYRAQGLRVVLVHTQEEIDLAKFMYERYPINRALVTADNPIIIGDTTHLALPRAALVGIDGKLLAAGSRAEVGKLIDGLIPKELARMKDGWGADPVIAKARSEFYSEMKFASAHFSLEAHEPTETEAKKDVEEARVEVYRHFDVVIQALRFRLDAGLMLEAETGIKALEVGVKGKDVWEERVAELRARLESEAGQADLALAKKIDRHFAKVEKGGVKAGMAAALLKSVKGHEQTAVGMRALRIASIWRRVEED